MLEFYFRFRFFYVCITIGTSFCICLPNVVQIGTSATELWCNIHFQDAGHGAAILLPVWVFVISLIWEGRNIPAYQISAKYLNLRLSYCYFWFLKTNVRHFGILLPVPIFYVCFTTSRRVIILTVSTTEASFQYGLNWMPLELFTLVQWTLYCAILPVVCSWVSTAVCWVITRINESLIDASDICPSQQMYFSWVCGQFMWC